MDIKSKFLGNQQIDPETIITFPEGIPGFEDQTRFKLFHQEDNPVIFWMQSVDDEDLTFSVSSPRLFNINYSFLLTDEEQTLLKLENVEDLIILILLHTDETGGTQEPTIKGSIRAPILINSASKIGFQKRLNQIEQSITLTEANNEIDLQETR
ncbi:MAG: flagellar assembly protein FliW [Gammaproteobacteria bacterium]